MKEVKLHLKAPLSKNNRFRLAAVLLTLSLLISFTACGSKKASMDTATSSAVGGTAAKSFSIYSGETAAVKNAAKSQETPAMAESAFNSVSNSSAAALSSAILDQRKVIRSASITIEVDEFEKAYEEIRTLINGIGYIQETSIRNDKIYSNNEEILLTKGTIIIRVAKDKFDSILYGIKNLGTLREENITSNDVTDQYFDVESRLKVLRLEEERLLEYLSKLNDLDSIFKAESRLSSIRQEIENLTGTLNKWNNLVELSIITIFVNEKNPLANTTAKEKSYLKKLWESFVGSVNDIIDFCGELILGLAALLPVIVFLAIIGLPVYKIFRKRSKAKKDVPQPAEYVKPNDKEN